MLENAGYYCAPLRYVHPESEFKYVNNYCVSIPDQQGPSYNYDAAAMKSEGLAAAQADTLNAGGMVDNSGAYFDPSGNVPACSADNSNYYGEYQQWRYQQGRSNQYQAGDTAVVSAGSEVFSDERQAGGPALPVATAITAVSWETR
jgi:hypothetical protein